MLISHRSANLRSDGVRGDNDVRGDDVNDATLESHTEVMCDCDVKPGAESFLSTYMYPSAE
jgi:hypothetical protein